MSSCHFQQSSFTNTYSKPPYLLESRYPQSASLPTRNLASSNCYHKGNHTTYSPLSTESPGDNKGTQLFEHKRQTYNSVSKTLKKNKVHLYNNIDISEFQMWDFLMKFKPVCTALCVTNTFYNFFYELAVHAVLQLNKVSYILSSATWFATAYQNLFTYFSNLWSHDNG